MMPRETVEADACPAKQTSFWDAIAVWFRIGVLSFGGPTAQIALMHRVIVDEKKWLSEQQFLHALSFCMLLPGPEAMQLATYAGWRLFGVAGGLAAGLLFVLPGAFVVLALAIIYAEFGQVPLVEALFFGVKAAVLVIVVEALLRIAKRALKIPLHWFVAAFSFVAIFVLAVPFPLIILVAALLGYFLGVQPSDDTSDHQETITAKPGDTLRTILVWLAIWLLPLAALSLLTGDNQIYDDLGWFFSKLAVVTFGGAYAVLAYMGQDVVVNHGWLEAGQMMGGLGLAETTPGPLILVTEFVGFIASHRAGGEAPILAGIFGALVALWATFAPCFLWIFAGAPYIEWLNGRPRLRGALIFITAAVVGVILNLALWFALHVFFSEVESQAFGIIQLWIPVFATLDWRVVLLAAVSGVLLLWRHWGIPQVLLTSALLALGWDFLAF